jgi:hypothetical protein
LDAVEVTLKIVVFSFRFFDLTLYFLQQNLLLQEQQSFLQSLKPASQGLLFKHSGQHVPPFAVADKKVFLATHFSRSSLGHIMHDDDVTIVTDDL